MFTISLRNIFNLNERTLGSTSEMGPESIRALSTLCEIYLRDSGCQEDFSPYSKWGIA